MGLKRTQYWNVTAGALRGGPTGRRSSRMDLQSYLDPVERLRAAGSWSRGVVDGMRVTATADVAGLQVGPGIAVDASGRAIVLETDGVTMVDPNIPESEDVVLNVPTVPVGTDGVVMATTGPAGDRLLTVRWREVQDGPAAAPVLLHAPWLQLVDPAGFDDAGTKVVLALVTLDDAGAVKAVGIGRRVASGSGGGAVGVADAAGGRGGAGCGAGDRAAAVGAAGWRAGRRRSRGRGAVGGGRVGPGRDRDGRGGCRCGCGRGKRGGVAAGVLGSGVGLGGAVGELRGGRPKLWHLLRRGRRVASQGSGCGRGSVSGRRGGAGRDRDRCACAVAAGGGLGDSFGWDGGGVVVRRPGACGVRGVAWGG